MRQSGYGDLRLSLLECRACSRALHSAAPGGRFSLVVHEHLHLVDEVPGNSQDLLGVMMFSPLWGGGNMDNCGEAVRSPVPPNLA